MKRNKIIMLGSTIFACSLLAGCGGGGSGGGSSTPKIVGMKVDFLDKSRKLHFGEKLTLLDFIVTIQYDNGSTSVAPHTKIEVYDGYVPATLPYALSYDMLGGLTRSLTFVYQKEISKTFYFDVEKKYQFFYSDSNPKTFNDFIYKNLDDSNPSFDNPLIAEGVSNVTYSSSKPKFATVDSNGSLKIASSPEGTGTIVSSYINNVCVDQYQFQMFSNKIDDMKFDTEYSFVCFDDDTATGVTRSTFNPNSDGKLFFPSAFSKDNYMATLTSIGDEDASKGAFEDCSSITSVKIPHTVEVIQANAFKNSGLTSASFDVTDKWHLDGGQDISPTNVKNETYMANLLKSGTMIYRAN